MTPTIISEFGTVYNLTDAVSCYVTRSLETGVYELELLYPANGVNVEVIKNGLMIDARPAPGVKAQRFGIYSVTRTLAGEVEVLARHVSNELAGIPVKPFTAGSASAALAALKTYEALPYSASDFEYSSYVTSSTTMTVKLPKSAWDCLFGEEDSIITIYGGEIDFDNYTVMHVPRIGRDRGVTIRYGKNLTELTENAESGGVNGIFPYWYKEDVGLVYPAQAEAAAEATGWRNVEIRDYTGEFKDIPTESQLSDRAEIDAENLIDRELSLTFSFEDLSRQKEYETIASLEKVFIGDTVRIVCKNPDIKREARVVETVFDTLADRYESVSAGSSQTGLAGTIEGGIADQNEALHKALKGIVTTKSIDLTTTYSINAGQAKGTNPATNVDIYAGYYPLEVVRMRASNNNISFSEARLNRGAETTVTFGARNNASSNLSGVTIRAIILYIKNEYQVTLS